MSDTWTSIRKPSASWEEDGGREIGKKEGEGKRRRRWLGDEEEVRVVEDDKEASRGAWGEEEE